MGFFNFFNSSSQKNNEIQNLVFKLSKGLEQINEDLQNNNGKVTPFVKGVLLALSEDSRKLYNLLSPNGRTDWSLANQKVKLHNGKETTVTLFCSRLYQEGLYLYNLTGINIAFSL